MNLRLLKVGIRRFSSIILLSLLFVGIVPLAIFVMTDSIIVKETLISSLESRSIDSGLYQAEAIFNTKADELEKVARDYGIWDDCYKKIREKDKRWFTANYSSWIPGNFKADVVIVADRKKEIIDEYCNDRDFVGEIVSNKVINNILKLKPGAAKQVHFSGLMTHSGKVYIVVASPITRSFYKGRDVRGVLVIAKKITPQFFLDMSRKFKIRMMLEHQNDFIGTRNDYRELKKFLPSLKEKLDHSVAVLDSRIIIGIRELKGFGGGKFGRLLVIQSPRMFYSTLLILRMITAVLISLAALFIIFLSNRLKNRICHPLLALNRQIGAMTGKDDMDFVSYEGPLEIEELASTFNNLVANIRTKDTENCILKEASYTDALTGLYNKRYFLEYAEEILKTKREAALLFCDIDHFKWVNDTHGHLIGDKVLKEVSRILKEEIDGIGRAFRYGGEEFSCIVHRIPMGCVYEIAENIRERIMTNSEIQLYRTTCPITISIGISFYPKDTRDLNDLIRKADKAVYFAKENGRNQCILFEELVEEGI